MMLLPAPEVLVIAVCLGSARRELGVIDTINAAIADELHGAGRESVAA